MAQPSGNKQQHKIKDYRKTFGEGLFRSESEFENFTLSVNRIIKSNSYITLVNELCHKNVKNICF